MAIAVDNLADAESLTAIEKEEEAEPEDGEEDDLEVEGEEDDEDENGDDEENDMDNKIDDNLSENRFQRSQSGSRKSKIRRKSYYSQDNIVQLIPIGESNNKINRSNSMLNRSRLKLDNLDHVKLKIEEEGVIMENCAGEEDEMENGSTLQAKEYDNDEDKLSSQEMNDKQDVSLPIITMICV